MQEETTQQTGEEQAGETQEAAEQAKEEEKPCWEVNPGCGTGECTSICPAYVNKTPCWQFDWKTAMEGMDEMSKAEIVKLVQNCPTCPVYQKHPEEINKLMKLVLK
jgi:hypothetical protein